MTRVVAAAGLLLAVACNALAWSLPFGAPSGNRTARGTGTFPRWQAVALATEAPIKWLVALPGRRLATVDREGALAIFEVGPSGLRMVARYGGVASHEGPPVAVRLDHAQTGVVLVAPDGRLLAWSDGVLRGYDVGGPRSSATCPTPITFDDHVAQDLLAVARDGAVVLIAGLGGGGPGKGLVRSRLSTRARSAMRASRSPTSMAMARARPSCSRTRPTALRPAPRIHQYSLQGDPSYQRVYTATLVDPVVNPLLSVKRTNARWLAGSKPTTS